MALPALKLEREEEVVEERVARLEANVEHLQSDVTDIKSDVRRLNEKVDSLKDFLSNFQLAVEKSLAELRSARAMDRVWWLLMCAALLGVMAKGFKWL